MRPWRRYVDDTIKPEFITDVINIFSKFHKNIRLIYEVDQYGKISFLYVLLMKSNEKLETIIFYK